MARTMPGIEFNEGIPESIDKPDYLDVSQRNLIVLDDLMAQSGKDKLFKSPRDKQQVSMLARQVNPGKV